MTEQEFQSKWDGVNIDELSEDRFREFKQDCFDLYEATGFLDTFDSPYDDHGEHNGMPFKVLRRAKEGECDLEAMPLWLIEFENGDTAYCYPEEITKLESSRNNKKN